MSVTKLHFRTLFKLCQCRFHLRILHASMYRVRVAFREMTGASSFIKQEMVNVFHESH